MSASACDQLQESGYLTTPAAFSFFATVMTPAQVLTSASVAPTFASIVLLKKNSFVDGPHGTP